MPRFVILEHDHPELHWDFMLENGEHLRTWKLLENPSTLAGEKTNILHISIKAEPHFDHRLIYLDYEGPISGDRGSVKRFDFGTFEWLKQSNSETHINLQGQKLKGPIILTEASLTIGS